MNTFFDIPEEFKEDYNINNLFDQQPGPIEINNPERDENIEENAPNEMNQNMNGEEAIEIALNEIDENVKALKENEEIEKAFDNNLNNIDNNSENRDEFSTEESAFNQLEEDDCDEGLITTPKPDVFSQIQTDAINPPDFNLPDQADDFLAEEDFRLHIARAMRVMRPSINDAEIMDYVRFIKTALFTVKIETRN